MAAKVASDEAGMLAELRALNQRMKRATTSLDECERQRSELYAKARAMDPPLTFKQIADVFGVTPAAVMQKLDRATEQAASKPKTKRKPRSRATSAA